MDKRIPVLAVLLVFVAFLGYYGYITLSTPTKEYAYKLDYEGMLFLSNEAEASDYLPAFTGFNEFIVSPAFGKDDVALMTKPLILFQGVLSAKQKRVILLARVFEGNSLKYCQTNDANVLVNREISIEECNSLLSSYIPKIMINKPDSTLKQTTIVLENNSITISPKNEYDLMNASYAVLRTMFEDIEEIIQNMNKIITALPR